jgi:cell division protein FtsN
MTVTTRKSNATAHPGAPDLPQITRRSSKEVAEEKTAKMNAKLLEARLTREQRQAVADMEAEMAAEDAEEQRNAARPRSKQNSGESACSFL